MSHITPTSKIGIVGNMLTLGQINTEQAINVLLEDDMPSTRFVMKELPSLPDMYLKPKKSNTGLQIGSYKFKSRCSR